MQAESVEQACLDSGIAWRANIGGRLHVPPCMWRPGVDVVSAPVDVCGMSKAWRAAGHIVLGSITGILAACEPTDRSVSDTTVAPPGGGVEAGADAAPTGQWDAGAGSVFLVREDSVTRAVFPLIRQLDSSVVLDESMVRELEAEGVAATGAAGTLRVRGFAAAEEICTAWPTVAISTDAPRDWNVAFQRGVATPLSLRSIESSRPADSARVAGQITNLAASLPNDTTRAFRGLPFTIRAAYTFTPAPGVEALVAEIVRRVNVEANPREESVLFIAERMSGSAQWRTAYAEHSSGAEDDVERASALVAVKLAPAALPTLVIERTGTDWVAYALIQRDADGQWNESWESAYSGC